ncbi:ATP-dependent DNA ligase domain protein [Striga asiatica]|uniref:ATP-dependent DNA ligase domain protein n=1 Tax=Striga asiatica TaxID=4170 RepID=A0A5A7Q6A5_STRAF|nr:ATP-dependent DNA ligase domain protein [Striga asiatica]
MDFMDFGLYSLFLRTCLMARIRCTVGFSGEFEARNLPQKLIHPLDRKRTGHTPPFKPLGQLHHTRHAFSGCSPVLRPTTHHFPVERPIGIWLELIFPLHITTCLLAGILFTRVGPPTFRDFEDKRPSGSIKGSSSDSSFFILCGCDERRADLVLWVSSKSRGSSSNWSNESSCKLFAAFRLFLDLAVTDRKRDDLDCTAEEYLLRRPTILFPSVNSPSPSLSFESLSSIVADCVLPSFGAGVFLQLNKKHSSTQALAISSTFTLFLGFLKHAEESNREHSKKAEDEGARKKAVEEAVQEVFGEAS